eukprot:TRINITY_DN4681_c0_g1_i3.p1 TRINITY_DN4681_c0_g1~~TRINITY_DN4681_c0_g1_i3.p1  ORF type:complete len:275 (+),score=49.82 TRINITY_DN4681_c0_g1_i3:338-1162(+)
MINDNRLNELNPKIVVLYKLEKLCAEHNNIASVPWGIDRLKRLKILYLHNNMIDFVPNTIANLTLTEFRIDKNPLADCNDATLSRAIESGNTKLIWEGLKNQEIPSQYQPLAKAEESVKNKLKPLTISDEDSLLFIRVLRNSKGNQILLSQMKKEFADENLEFWNALDAFYERFNSESEITTKELITEAKIIFDTYISHSSKSATVNLPASVQDPIIKIFTDTFSFPKGINQWVFNGAYQAVFDLMCRDSFFRFRSTDEGSKFLKSITKEKSDK